MSWWQQPFFQVALPVILAFAIATLFQSKHTDSLGKRIDDLRDSLNHRVDGLENSMNQRFDATERRLERIENLLTEPSASRV